jgi:hypothetical protein
MPNLSMPSRSTPPASLFGAPARPPFAVLNLNTPNLPAEPEACLATAVETAILA